MTQPTRVDDLPDNISEPSICTAVGGGGHTFLLTAQGRLFGAGWNTSGQVNVFFGCVCLTSIKLSLHIFSAVLQV